MKFVDEEAVLRPLGELDLRVVCIDGKVFKEHCIVIALGIDTSGRKHVLGLREGATETAAVSTALLNDLVTRGLPTDRAMLFLVDGSAALRRALSDVYGSLGVVHFRKRPRNGLWSAWPARWRTSIPAPRHPSAKGWTRRRRCCVWA